MHIAIVIVSFRNPDDLCECLTQLSGLSYTDFSIHICENGGNAEHDRLIGRLSSLADAEPSVGSEEHPSRMMVLKQGGQRVYVHAAPGNLGYAGGINYCIRRLPQLPEWGAVWILNPDTLPDSFALQGLVDRLNDSSYGVVGSRLVLKATNRVQLYGGRWRPWIARGFNIGLHAPADAVPNVADVESSMTYVNGASMLVSRAFIEAVGLMREDYFLYNEEIDWCFRRGAFALGYAHASLVYHAHGSTMGSNVDRRARSRLSVYLDERNKLIFTRRFFPVRYPIIAVVALLLTLQYVKAGAFRNFGNALAGWWAGVRGETGKPSWVH